MIDPEIEELLTIREAAKLPQFRRNGRPIHFSTVFRWIDSGKLESVTIGGCRLTSREAVARMISSANPGAAIPTVTPRERERQIRTAERRLELAGV